MLGKVIIPPTREATKPLPWYNSYDSYSSYRPSRSYNPYSYNPYSYNPYIHVKHARWYHRHAMSREVLEYPSWCEDEYGKRYEDVLAEPSDGMSEYLQSKRKKRPESPGNWEDAFDMD